MWGSEGRVCGRSHFLGILSPLQALHPQADQEAGEVVHDNEVCTIIILMSKVVSLINHCDSPYIRGLGFMYLRFTLPANMMYDWYEPYLDDEEVCITGLRTKCSVSCRSLYHKRIETE